MKIPIYDQYLGQVFNKFNRLIFHENQQETTSYLCKLLAEEYYQVNDIEKTINYLTYYYSNSKAKTIDLPIDFLNKKTELILCQESFVLAHELTHFLIEQSPSLLEIAYNFVENNQNARLIFKNAINDFSGEKNVELLLSHFYEELTCDLIACQLVYSFFSMKKLSPQNITEGVCLAFLYLRTLSDVKQKARKEYLTSNDIFKLFQSLRYNLLRHFIAENYDSIDLMKFVEQYEIWEEKIDKDMVCYLDDQFEKNINKTLKSKGMKYSRELAQKLLKL